MKEMQDADVQSNAMNKGKRGSMYPHKRWMLTSPNEYKYQEWNLQNPIGIANARARRGESMKDERSSQRRVGRLPPYCCKER